MQRKYLTKEDPNQGNNDPLDYSKRQIHFHKQPSNGETEALTEKQESGRVTAQSNQPKQNPVLEENKEAAIRRARFNENLKFLQGDGFSAEPQEFQKLGKEFESDKIGQEVTGLLYQYEKQKMSMVQRQIQEERALVQDLNEKIETNIAKFVNLESKLKHRQEELEVEVSMKTKKLVESERLAAIGELSSRLAHDLKNPLSILKMFTELLRLKSKDNSDAAFLRKLEAANSAIYRMTHQIDNVLDYVRNAPLQRETTTIHDVIKLALTKVPDMSNVSLTIEQQNLEINCDKTKMATAFANMIINSIQAMQSQGTMAIRFSQNNDGTAIEFVDSGPGIPQEVLPKIFEPLFTTKQQGTGLGLATCKNIIGEHGGKIYVKNNPTTFTVIIPRNGASQ